MHVELDKKHITRIFVMVFNGKLHHSLLHVLHVYKNSGTHISPSHPAVTGKVTVQMSLENWLHMHNDIFFWMLSTLQNNTGNIIWSETWS